MKLRNWHLHLIVAVVVLAVCGNFWWIVYEAQFLPYDDNYGNLLTAFGMSIVLTISVVITWFARRNWVEKFKWEIGFFLLTTGPVTIALACIYYKDVFGATLMN